LKWAGGKRWLTEKHFDLLNVEYDRFVEPFLGSGAMFFCLEPKNAILSDSNSRLIEAYRAIRDNWEEVEKLLELHHKKHSQMYYYEMRSKKLRKSVTRAAQFIYLNRTCWNGLYRVNLKGEFNVPIGTKSNVVLDTDDFQRTSQLLSKAQLNDCDFEETLESATSGDFLFVDPPYTVKHNHNGFIKYNESLFSWNDQIRLRDCVRSAIQRGAQVLVTNANHESVKELYQGTGETITLNRASVISGKSAARGRYEEMVIKCY